MRRRSLLTAALAGLVLAGTRLGLSPEPPDVVVWRYLPPKWSEDDFPEIVRPQAVQTIWRDSE